MQHPRGAWFNNARVVASEIRARKAIRVSTRVQAVRKNGKGWGMPAVQMRSRLEKCAFLEEHLDRAYERGEELYQREIDADVDRLMGPDKAEAIETLIWLSEHSTFRDASILPEFMRVLDELKRAARLLGGERLQPPLNLAPWEVVYLAPANGVDAGEWDRHADATGRIIFGIQR